MRCSLNVYYGRWVMGFLAWESNMKAVKFLGCFATMFMLCGIVACGDSSSTDAPIDSVNNSGHTEFQTASFASCGGVPKDVLNSFGKNVAAPSAKNLARKTYACAQVEQELTVADLKGSVKDSLGNPMGNISIYLPARELYAVEAGEKITTDENGDFVLRNIPYKVYIENYFGEGDTSYYYSKKMQVVSSDKKLGAFAEIDLEKADTVRINGFVYLDVGTIVVEPLYSLKVSLEDLDIKKGDEYCLEWISPCHKVTADEMKEGFFVMEGIPAGTYLYSYGNKKTGFMGGSAQVVTVGP